jgi:hypothetical protein
MDDRRPRPDRARVAPAEDRSVAATPGRVRVAVEGEPARRVIGESKTGVSAVGPVATEARGLGLSLRREAAAVVD